MTSASDRTDDRIIVSPADEDEDVADAQVIHGTIVHDDEQDEAGADDERAGYEPLHAGQTEDDETGDEPPWRMGSAAEQTPEEAGPGHEPRRAWIPEAPVSGAGGPGQPIAARSVPAQRAPFEAESDESDSDESDSDESDSDESVAEVPEPSSSAPSSSVPSQSVPSQSAFTQSAPSRPAVFPTDSNPTDSGLADSGLADSGLADSGQADSDQAELDEPELDELEPVAPVPSQPSAAGPAAGLTEPGTPEPASDSPWPGIQSMFVDDPRRAVEQAAKVTSTALADLITAAKEQERTLRSDWQPDRTGTEELRVALRGYRDLAGRIATLTRGF